MIPLPVSWAVLLRTAGYFHLLPTNALSTRSCFFFADSQLSWAWGIDAYRFAYIHYSSLPCLILKCCGREKNVSSCLYDKIRNHVICWYEPWRLEYEHACHAKPQRKWIIRKFRDDFTAQVGSSKVFFSTSPSFLLIRSLTCFQMTSYFRYKQKIIVITCRSLFFDSRTHVLTKSVLSIFSSVRSQGKICFSLSSYRCLVIYVRLSVSYVISWVISQQLKFTSRAGNVRKDSALGVLCELK